MVVVRLDAWKGASRAEMDVFFEVTATSKRGRLKTAVRLSFTMESVKAGKDVKERRRVKVVHISGVPSSATCSDLIAVAFPFGAIAYVTSSPEKGVALVEFEAKKDAEKFVSKASEGDMQICDTKVAVRFATCDSITRGPLESTKPGRFLVLTIVNSRYHIDVCVIHKISRPNGFVKRIVIMRGDLLQAIVEFDDVDVARRAKYSLNGADIFADCCTIRAEFCELTILDVTKNDDDHWNYKLSEPLPTCNNSAVPKESVSVEVKCEAADLVKTEPELTKPVVTNDRKRPLDEGEVSSSAVAVSPDSSWTFYSSWPGFAYYSQYAALGFPMPSNSADSSGFFFNQQPSSSLGAFPAIYNEGNVAESLLKTLAAHSDGSPSGESPLSTGSVLMVYGIDREQFNCDKLFNLLCLYGNCLRVIFLYKKADTVMVQMGTAEEAERVVELLNDVVVFGKKLRFEISKQPYVIAKNRPFELADGTSCYKDFSNCGLLRFSSKQDADRNRCNPPSKILFFHNVPMHITKEDIRKTFVEGGAVEPLSVVFLESTNRKSRFRIGICGFPALASAIDAVVLVNHAIFTDDNETCHLRLAFADPIRNKAIVETSPSPAEKLEAALKQVEAVNREIEAMGREAAQLANNNSLEVIVKTEPE